jgi:hypothetical protein
MKTKCKSIIRAACHSFGGTICAGAVQGVRFIGQQINHLKCVAVILATLAAGQHSNAQIIVNVDPGPVGSIFASEELAFNNLNGMAVSGQTLDLDFVFPDNINAEYLSLGGRGLYGWCALLYFSGGYTVTANPHPISTYVLDSYGNAVAPGVGMVSVGNGSSGQPGSNFVGYNANFNVVYSLQELIDFTGVPYHSVEMCFQLPDFAENDVTISSASFLFETWTISGEDGDRTEIVPSSVPEPSALGLLAVGATAFLVRRRRNLAA